MKRPRTLAAAATGLDRLVGVAALTSLVLLVAGWILPVMTVRAFFVFPRRISLADAVRELWQADQLALLALTLWYRTDRAGPRLQRSLSLLAELAKWSMLDVFVVALTVIGIQVAVIGNAFVNPGFYAFVAAILLSMIVVRRVVALARRHGRATT